MGRNYLVHCKNLTIQILFRDLLNIYWKAVNIFLVVLTIGFIMTLLYPFLPVLMLCFDTALHKFWFNSILLDLWSHHCMNRSMTIPLFTAWNSLLLMEFITQSKVINTCKMLLKHTECIRWKMQVQRQFWVFLNFKNDVLNDGHILCSMWPRLNSFCWTTAFKVLHINVLSHLNFTQTKKPNPIFLSLSKSVL